jgi:DNA recombination protein RmuC
MVVANLVGLMSGWLLRNRQNASVRNDYAVAQARIAFIENELATATQTISELRNTITTLHQQNARLDATNRHLTDALASQKADTDTLQKRLTTEFENMANRLLSKTTQTVTQHNRENLTDVLKPFTEKLMDLGKKVTDSYTHEAKERASLQGELKQLLNLNQTMALEAKNLSTALKGESKVQGNWGETILERLLETSGLQKGREFTVQPSFTTAEGRRQPDVIVHLPENRHLIIDAKVSLTAYAQYFATENADEKKAALDRHVSSIRSHIKQLRDKNYTQLTTNSPDFVIMFMPIEPAFGLAMQHNDSLFLDALNNNVLLVSPSSLLATLRIIATMWTNDRQNKHALDIAEEGGKLYDKFVSFLEDLNQMGRQLNTVTTTYASLSKKLSEGTGNIIGRTKKLEQLGIKARKQLPDTAVYSEAMASKRLDVTNP